jgi:hypothetical protein
VVEEVVVLEDLSHTAASDVDYPVGRLGPVVELTE